MVITFTEAEIAALRQIRKAGVFDSKEDAIKGALFYFARLMGVEIPIEVFALSVPPSLRTKLESEHEEPRGALLDFETLAEESVLPLDTEPPSGTE